MEIQYTVNRNDMREFVLHEVRHSPLFRGQRISHILLPILMLVIGIVTSVYYADMKYILPWILAAVGIGVFIVWLRKKGIASFAMRRYPSAGGGDFFGPRTMRISSDGLVLITPTKQMSLDWTSIERVECAASHCFIYTDSPLTIVLPIHSVVSGEYSDFVGSLQSYLKGRNA